MNDGRVKLEEMIDYFHKTYAPWKKPRTYRNVARREYLAVAKSKKRTTKKLRSLVRKQLECLRRDLGYLGHIWRKSMPCRQSMPASI